MGVGTGVATGASHLLITCSFDTESEIIQANVASLCALQMLQHIKTYLRSTIRGRIHWGGGGGGTKKAIALFPPFQHLLTLFCVAGGARKV